MEGQPSAPALGVKKPHTARRPRRRSLSLPKRDIPAGTRRSWGRVPPPLFGQFLRYRPDLVQGYRIEQLTALDYQRQIRRVADVLKRIAVQDDEIGELARRNLADVLGNAYDLRTMARCGRQCFFIRQPAAGQRPQFPVIAKPLELTVPADPNPASGADDLCGLGGDPGKVVFLLVKPLAPLRP